MSEFNIRSANRMPPGPSGMGAKVVQGHVSIRSYKEAVHPSDVKLNTIKALFVETGYVGTLATVRVVEPGTFGNYASLALFDMTGTQPVEITTGTDDGATTIEAEFLAFGE